jgi:hypothetical protein
VTSYYLGIDPGASGAIAYYMVKDDSSTAAMMLELKAATRREVYEFLQGFTGYAWRHQAYAAVEKVSSMPGQGVASTFKFGVNYGGLLMALDAAGIPFLNPTPTTWKKAVDPYLIAPKEAKTEKKRRAREIAKRLFPTAKVTNATADALLLARYAQLKAET